MRSEFNCGRDLGIILWTFGEICKTGYWAGGLGANIHFLAQEVGAHKAVALLNAPSILTRKFQKSKANLASWADEVESPVFSKLQAMSSVEQDRGISLNSCSNAAYIFMRKTMSSLSQSELNCVTMQPKTKQLYFNMHYLVEVSNELVPRNSLAR